MQTISFSIYIALTAFIAPVKSSSPSCQTVVRLASVTLGSGSSSFAFSADDASCTYPNCCQREFQAADGMALTMTVADSYAYSSSILIQRCTSQSCNQTTDLGQPSTYGQQLWASTGYMLVTASMNSYDSFSAEVSLSCPQQGYFRSKIGQCQQCKSCDPNSDSPNKTCQDGSLEDFSGYCSCNDGYSGDGYSCWKCDPPCSYSTTCSLNNQSKPVCKCSSGTYGDGISCSVCTTCSYSSTTPGATCAEGSTSDVSCQCKRGYYGNGEYCYSCSSTCGLLSTTPGATCPAGSQTDSVVCACMAGFYGDGIQCTPCSTCDPNANTTAPCAEGSTTDVTCVCNSGYYGTGLTCKELPTTPAWIVNLAIAFGVLAIIGSILAVHFGLVDRLAKFETEAQFKWASKLKFRIAIFSQLGVCVLLYPLFNAIVNLGQAYQRTCSRTFDKYNALDFGALCMVCLVAGLLVSWCIPCHANPLTSDNCWGKISRFCRPKIGTISFLLSVSCFAAAEIFFFITGMTCWNQLDVLPIHGAAVALFVLFSITYDCFLIFFSWCRRNSVAAVVEVKPIEFKSTFTKVWRIVKAFVSSEHVLLVRTVMLLVVTIISVAELDSTNFSTALESCQEGWKRIFRQHGMASGEFFQTTDAKFLCTSATLSPNCSGLSVSQITIGPNCTSNKFDFSNKIFLTVINTTSTSNASAVVQLIHGATVYNVTDLSPFITASQNSQNDDSYSGTDSSGSSSSYSDGSTDSSYSSGSSSYSQSYGSSAPSSSGLIEQVASESNYQLFQSPTYNRTFNLDGCSQVSVKAINLWITQPNTLPVDASFGMWNSTYTGLCPYQYQCQIDLLDSEYSTCSSSIQLSKWYYSNAYISCDTILFSESDSSTPIIETVYLTSGNIGLNLLPTIFTLISLWRSKLWIKGPDGNARPVNPSWDATGPKLLLAACSMSAYSVMEMAGVPDFSGGLALKVVALALHTLHAILFSVVLGWAVPDIIRWESEVFLFTVVYSWYDLRMVILAAKQRTQHFGPKKKEETASWETTQEAVPEQASMRPAPGTDSKDAAPEVKAEGPEVTAAVQTADNASPSDVEAGIATGGAGKAAGDCAYVVYFAKSNPVARLFFETESMTCEDRCSFKPTEGDRHFDISEGITSTLFGGDAGLGASGGNGV